MKIPNKILYKLVPFALLIGIMSTTFISFAAPSNWAKDDYFLLNYEELLSDELADQSKLSRNITREEFAELAIRLYSKASKKDFNLMAKNNPFVDTNNEYVAMAYNAKLVNGTSESKFSPTASITREQLASIVYNELKILGVETSYDTNVTIADKSSVSSWALEAVKFCIDNDILLNSDGNNFRPKSSATREESIATINRVAKKYSWISDVEVLGKANYKLVNTFSVPEKTKTDLLIYKPDNSKVDLRIYHNGIVNLNTVFNFKKLDKQILDILDKSSMFDYETAFMVSSYVKENWDNTNKTFVFESTKYFKDAKVLKVKPTGSYIEIKSGSYLEINIYK